MGFQKGHKMVPGSEKGWFKKGTHFNLGRKHTPEHIEKNRLAQTGRKQSKETIAKRIKQQTGEKHWNWKGGDVNYVALHAWVSRWKGKPSKCEMCGTENAKKYEWANIDHKYRRVLEDYIRVCTSCHRKFDVENNDYKIYGK